jgi:hypothetical protein
MVQLAFATGFGGPLSGKICTALGITTNNEPLPVEQISVNSPVGGKAFNVSRHRGRLDIIIAIKTKDATTLFLTSATGGLEKAIVQKQGQPILEMPAADAVADFEREKAWWLETYLKTHNSVPGGK